MLGYANFNDASPQATFLFDDIQQTTSELSTEELISEFPGLSAFPNPANDMLTIRSEEQIIRTITLFDVLGNEVSFIQPNDQQVVIDVSELASGVYIAKISTLTEQGSIRPIIE